MVYAVWEKSVTDLKTALLNAVDWCDNNAVELPLPLQSDLACYAVKTLGYFQSTLERLVKTLYGGLIDEMQFVTIAGDLLEGQLREAWREGMWANGLEMGMYMTPELNTMLYDIINGEKSHLVDFGDAILEARAAGTPVDGLLTRADLWTARYQDVVNQATLVTAEPKDKLEWIYGDTVHCSTCEALNGIVATAAEWAESGLHPQQPENPLLECGGWRCQCTLEPTDKRHTRGALDRLLAIAGGR